MTTGLGPTPSQFTLSIKFDCAKAAKQHQQHKCDAQLHKPGEKAQLCGLTVFPSLIGDSPFGIE